MSIPGATASARGLSSEIRARFERASRAVAPALAAESAPDTERMGAGLNENREGPRKQEPASGRQARSLTPHEQVAALYDDYYPRIYRYLQSLHLGAEEIEELIQEVFLRFTTQLLEGREIDSPQGWVIRVAHNLAMDFQQKKSRRGQNAADEERALSVDRADPAPNQEQQYLQEEQMRRMERALMNFKLRDRQCFVMRAQGMSYKDIAAAMKISEQRAGTIVNKVAMRLAVICE